MQFGHLNINPALSPAVLDTATWDAHAAWATVSAIDDSYWLELLAAATNAGSGAEWPAQDGFVPFPGSAAIHQGTLYFLAQQVDGQRIFIALGRSLEDTRLGEPIGVKSLAAATGAVVQNEARSDLWLALYPTSAAVIDRYCRVIAPGSGPQALGPAPRLGIGTRMTTAVWPAIWQAMAERRFAANAIQNSVRELNFLETLLAGRPAEKNIAFGFGTIETGYTGSSYEGLWVAGVLNALEHGVHAIPSTSNANTGLRYGADADHIQVKRGADGLARAQRLLDATRYYSFYTLDVSDVLDYDAMVAGPAAATAYLEAQLPDVTLRRALLAHHRQPRRLAHFEYRPGEATLGRLVGKYAVALDAVEALYRYLCARKATSEQTGMLPFDMELSIDEHPNDVPTFDCLTSETELAFVLLEAQRRGLPLTHVAPNFGVEKGIDYRGEDGLVGFEARIAALCRITEAFGVMPDFHSGDDLSAATRQAIGRATGGRNQFKVSPMLQLLFAEVLADYHPDLFRRWWEDALAYAQSEAAAGSTFAADCIRAAGADDVLARQPASALPSAHDAIFHHFSFAFVGRRDADGQFISREEFYSLSPAFYQAYQARLVQYLGELATDLF